MVCCIKKKLKYEFAVILIDVVSRIHFIARSLPSRTGQLKLALTAWRQGTEVSRSEREEDMRVAEAYWARATLRAHFTAWCDALLTDRACDLYNSNMLR